MMKPTDDSNPSVSLNFDAQALHNQEEAEYEREEQQRQQELRDLLTTAFDCDFTDEDEEDGSVESNGATSSDEPEPTSDRAQQNEIGWETSPPDIPNHVYGMPLQQPSTLMAGMQSLPSHSTPAPTSYIPQHLQHGPGPPAMHYPLHDRQYNYPTHDIGPGQQPQIIPNDWSGQLHQPTDQAFAPFQQLAFGQREEAEGGNEHPAVNFFDSAPQHQVHGNYYGNQDFSQQPTGPPPPPTDMYGPARQQEENAFMQLTSQQPLQPFSKDMAPCQGNPNIFNSRGSVDKPGDELEGYRVSYRGRGTTNQDQPEPDHLPSKAENIQLETPRQDHQSELEAVQLDFLSQVGASDGRQLGQLQILYDARGRKIEELTQEMKAVRDDSDREIRILKHKLALTQDERDGMDGSLKQSQTLLNDAHRREAESQGKINALEAQIVALQQNKEEIVKKLQTAESTIESLNMQLSELEKSESLSRARDHHNNIVTSMQHKYEAEILDLKEKLDKTTVQNQEKSDQNVDLKMKVKHLQKEMEEKQIERADTINRLSKSLENSQKQCEQMLEAGTGQELSKMKVQIQEVIAGKAIAEDMNTALSEELQELKEQVMMYESVSQLGIHPLGNSGGSTQLGGATYNAAGVAADDSYSQLGIKSNKGAARDEPGSNSSTPRSYVGDGSLSSEETLQGLKKELERCLTMYRTKRQQVTNLQDELRKTRYSLEEMTLKLGDAQKQAEDSVRKVAEYEAEVGPLGGKPGQESVQERRLQRQLDAVTKEKKLLEEEVNELMGRIEEIAESEERLKEANLELGHQMAEMVKEYDEDKRQALEQCESTVLQHHERVKAQLEADLRDEFSQDKDCLMKEYERKITQLTSELEHANEELNEVKDLYVTVCQSKEHLLESNEKLLQDRIEEKINEVMDTLQMEKNEEIKKLKETWSSNNDSALAVAKEKWMEEQEEEMRKQIDIKVELSKTTWLRDHAGAKETAVMAALKEAEEKWEKRFAEDLEQKVSEALNEAKNMWEAEKQSAITEEVVMLQASAQDEKILTEDKITKKIEEAHEIWRESELATALAEEKARYNDEIECRIEEARQNWRETELLPALNEAKELANKALLAQDPDDLKTEVASMLSEAKALWLEEQRGDVEARVLQIENAAAEEARKKIEESSLQMQEELAVMEKAKLEIENELATLHAKMAEEKASVISSKDAERRQAVITAQDQCERDYRAFLDEHQDTLNKALKTAREEFSKEVSELERKHADEIKGYKEREAKTNHAEVHFNKELADQEQIWHQKFEEIAAKHAEEKDALMRNHRENLLKALEEARQRWQLKYEEALEESSSLVNEKESSWEEERKTLQREIESLRSNTVVQHQQDVARLKAEMEKSSEIKVSQLKSVHQMELQTVSTDLRKQLDMRSAEMERLSEEVRACVAGLEEAQRVAAEEAQELKSAISQRDAEIARLKAELTASGQRVEQCEAINTDVIRKLEDMQKQTDKVERDKQETERGLTQMSDSYQDLIEKLQKSERKLKASELNTQKHIAMVQESMEREHSVAMEKMKARMVELRSNNVVALDNLRKQHATEKKEWKKMMEQLKLELSSDKLGDSGNEMSKKYMKAVTKIRAEVLRHVKESNARAAETVREQVVKERQSTAKRLRRYYMKCLNHILDAENQNMTREEKIAYMERALDYIPSRDTSQLTSRSSGRSNTSTPDNLTPRNTATSSTSTASSNTNSKANQARSRVDHHSPDRTKHSTSDSKIKESVENIQTRNKTARDDLTPGSGPHSFSHLNEHQSRQPRHKTVSGHRSLDSCELRRRLSQHDVPRLDLTNVGQAHIDSPSVSANKTSLRHSSSRRQKTAQVAYWDTENSSRDLAPVNSHYFKTSKESKREKRALNEASAQGDISNGYTPNGSRFNASSKSAEPYSIEKPRSSTSKSRLSHEYYDVDVEMPSIYNKSQVTSCLDHSTPRGLYPSEPRQYYDVDFTTFNSGALPHTQDRRSGVNAPLTKVNSETYLLTPVGLQSGLHGSMSMGDVRDLDESNQSLAESKHLCRSDEGILNSETDSIHYTPGRRSNTTYLSQGTGPLKSMSMPDVANPEDHAWIVNDRTNLNTYFLRENHDSGDTTLNDSTEASPYTSVRAKPRENNHPKIYSHKSHRSTNGKNIHAKKEHRVVFKNVDTNDEDDASDSESVKSFLSTSSVNSFRNALKTNQVKNSHSPKTSKSSQNSKSTAKPSGSSKPLKVPPPSEQLQHMLAQVPDNVYRPVAMVTRHTQMPSPRVVNRLAQQFEARD